MKLKAFVENFIEKFSKDDTTTLAASLAFYTALSLAPLLILFVTISAHFSERLQGNFVTEVRGMVGQEAARAIEMIIESAKTRPDLTSFASLAGVATLLVSASLIFGQLRATLNRIFDVELPGADGASFIRVILDYLKERLFHIGLALSFIFTMIVSLIASSVIAATVHSDRASLMMLLNVFINITFYVMLFTLLFRFLPDRRLPWGRAAQGGTLTSILFVVGKELIGIYLGNSAVGSSYGAAGSVIVLLVWVYYSALITFVGAQVSWLLHSPEHSPKKSKAL